MFACPQWAKNGLQSGYCLCEKRVAFGGGDLQSTGTHGVPPTLSSSLFQHPWLTPRGSPPAFGPLCEANFAALCQSLDAQMQSPPNECDGGPHFLVHPHQKYSSNWVLASNHSSLGHMSAKLQPTTPTSSDLSSTPYTTKARFSFPRPKVTTTFHLPGPTTHPPHQQTPTLSTMAGKAGTERFWRLATNTRARLKPCVGLAANV